VVVYPLREMFEKKTFLIVGRSQLPQGVSAKKVYDQMAVAMLVDCKYGVIVKVQPTLVTDLTNEFLSDLLIGCNLVEDMEEIENRLKQYYHGGAKNSLIAALKDLHRKFVELQPHMN
jgi:hypothetical protein